MNVELRYIHPVWVNRDQVSYIDVSPSPIEITEIDTHTFSANTLAFIRINENEDAYIGLKLLSNVSYIPYVEKPDGTKEHLKQIKLTDEDVWWIIANSWSYSDKEYRTQAFNRMGKISVKIGIDKLVLTNEANNFTYADLEYILNDFKSYLWQIIVDPNSLTSINIKQNIPIFSTSHSIADIENFLIHLEKMLKNPEKKIIEITEIKCKEKAKVIKNTLQELLKNPIAQKVSSRSFSESFDTPANRYLHFCLNRIVFILNIYKKISSERQNFIKGTLEKLEKDKIKYLNEDYKSLQTDVLRNQIEMIESQYRELSADLCDIRNHSDYDGQLTLSISFGKSWGNRVDRYFIDDPHLNIPDDYDYVALDLPPNWTEKLTVEYISKLRFIVTANVTYFLYQRTKVGLILKLQNITNVSIESDELTSLKEYKSLNSMSSNDDEDFLSREKNVARKKLLNFQKQGKELANRDIQIEPLLKKAKRLQRNFDNKGISIQNNYPQSILFVTNNSYAIPYNYFRKISKNLGINERLINQLEKIEKIGLIKIYEIYEFWCLISIIRVLVEKLSFKPDDNWSGKLVDAVFSRGKDSAITFLFTHDGIKNQINLRLTYQKTLPSGKRPDFVLEIEDGENNSNYKPLILDAKFRGDVTKEIIEKDIYDMYEGRKYGDYGDVFILHTSCKALFDEKDIFRSLSPLSWGAFSSYGGENQLNHTKGHIFFLPSPRYPASIDNLQRLVGAFLQQNSSLKVDEYTDTDNILCIGCGSNDLLISKDYTRSGNIKFIIECKKCGLKSERTLCFRCHRQKLYKNGPWWTYHITKATQVSNVVCPKCGAYF